LYSDDTIQQEKTSVKENKPYNKFKIKLQRFTCEIKKRIGRLGG